MTKSQKERYTEISRKKHEARQAELIGKLQKTVQLGPALAQAAHAHADRVMSSTADAFETDCEAGCSYCCHQPATVFAFEAIHIADILKKSRSKVELEVLKQKMKERVAGFKGGSVRENVNNKTVCPLLHENQCSVYGDRPLTCRMAHSFSVKRCRQSFHKDRTQVEIPMSLELLTKISGVIEGSFDGLPKFKLDGSLYELCSAVLFALVTPDAALRWASGDLGVFAQCIKDDT